MGKKVITYCAASLKLEVAKHTRKGDTCKHILTDNMKSVVIRRDGDGRPIWQHDYEAFMQTVGFETRLCKPRHPFTKGSVERLVRFVKENFIAGRNFWNISDLNEAALEWCNKSIPMWYNEFTRPPKILCNRHPSTV